MKARLISLGVAIGFTLALTLGFVFASGGTAPVTGGSGEVLSTNGAAGLWTVMDAMHDSPAMEAIHAQMPDDLRAQCDAMHEQMQQMMDGADSGMMGGDMSAHHPESVGGGMMGGSGAMMGS
jgi:hypothetical protein